MSIGEILLLAGVLSVIGYAIWSMYNNREKWNTARISSNPITKGRPWRFFGRNGMGYASSFDYCDSYTDGYAVNVHLVDGTKFARVKMGGIGSNVKIRETYELYTTGEHEVLCNLDAVGHECEWDGGLGVSSMEVEQEILTQRLAKNAERALLKKAEFKDKFRAETSTSEGDLEAK